MGFEKIPAPGSPENNEERIRFGEGGRQFSMTPEEKKAHEEAEARRRLLEQRGDIEARENEPGNLNLTPEEEEIAVKMVPDPETRKQLGPEALRKMIELYEEPEEEKAA